MVHTGEPAFPQEVCLGEVEGKYGGSRIQLRDEIGSSRGNLVIKTLPSNALELGVEGAAHGHEFDPWLGSQILQCLTNPVNQNTNRGNIVTDSM